MTGAPHRVYLVVEVEDLGMMRESYRILRSYVLREDAEASINRLRLESLKVGWAVTSADGDDYLMPGLHEVGDGPPWNSRPKPISYTVPDGE
jgi:hypothetical protein